MDGWFVGGGGGGGGGITSFAVCREGFKLRIVVVSSSSKPCVCGGRGGGLWKKKKMIGVWSDCVQKF